MRRRAGVCFRHLPAVSSFLKGNAKGFTLIEVVVSTLIVAVGIVALLGAFLSGLILVESGRGTAVASADARAVFEEMRRLSAGGIGPVTARDWAAWSRGAGLTTLQNEAVSVRFRNPAVDPVEATVTVSWSERNRNRSSLFTSFVTRR